ncbi:PTS transporter subunit EIIC [Clostridium perfringens]|nr:PTS transporter subunit EIIC [Clostridium perfringens]
MMKYFQRLGKSLMLPVAALPVAGILMGIGYWIDSSIGANNVIAGAIATFLLKSGGAIIDNMAILFAIGVAVGMSDDNDGAAGLAGLVSWLMITTLLSTSVVALLQGVDASEVNAAFGKIQNQFIGIVAGLIGASCYNRFKNTKLPDFLGFFSGKRCVAIVTALVSIVAALVLYFVYPIIYSGLVSFGKSIIAIGPIGAGLYGFFNRLLIPFGLHHALNSVFWFDVAGINDIANFWSATDGTLGVTGMYMSGFFPIMMFGLPAGAFAMYRCAKENKKKAAAGILLAAALSSFFTGVTEPLEFAFMFLAPALYFAHAVLTGISMAVVAALPVRAGFNFSAGFVDWFLSFKSPMALNPMYLIAIGLVVAVIYYVVFVVMIKKFDLKTPGREDDDEDDSNAVLANNDYTNVAKIILEGLGGASNITSIDNCVTRLRLEVKDPTLVNEKKIKSSGVAGVIRPGKTSVQVIVGTQVQFVADEFKKLCKSKNYV